MALNCSVFEKTAILYFGDRQTNRQTDRQTDEQMDSTDAVNRSCGRERRLNNLRTWSSLVINTEPTHRSRRSAWPSPARLTLSRLWSSCIVLWEYSASWLCVSLLYCHYQGDCLSKYPKCYNNNNTTTEETGSISYHRFIKDDTWCQVPRNIQTELGY